METQARSIVKTISYRIVGSLGTSLVAWALTHKLSISVAMGVSDVLVKIVLYYLHERLWTHIPFGRMPLKKEA